MEDERKSYSAFVVGLLGSERTDKGLPFGIARVAVMDWRCKSRVADVWIGCPIEYEKACRAYMQSLPVVFMANEHNGELSGAGCFHILQDLLSSLS